MSNKLSFIIPVYNLENYIKNCVDSILNQVLGDEIEVIIVNDGSTDNSLLICENLSLNESRIKLFSIKNSGVSVARNFGATHATGKYITFVDGDDFISNNLNNVIKALNSNHDLYICRSNINDNFNSENYKFPKNWTLKDYNGVSLFSETGYFRGSVCGVIFKKEVINNFNLKFIENLKNSEDTIFFNFALCLVNNVKFVDENFYLINKRANSASKIYDIRTFANQAMGVVEINKLLLQLGLDIEKFPNLNFLVYNIISNTFNRMIDSGVNYNTNEIIKIIKSSNLLPISTNNIPIRLNKIRILNFSMKIFYLSIKYLK